MIKTVSQDVVLDWCKITLKKLPKRDRSPFVLQRVHGLPLSEAQRLFNIIENQNDR